MSSGRMKHNSDSCLLVLRIKTTSHLKCQHQNDAQYTLDIREAVRKEPQIFTCLSVGSVLYYSWPAPYKTKRTWSYNRKHDCALCLFSRCMLIRNQKCMYTILCLQRLQITFSFSSAGKSRVVHILLILVVIIFDLCD